MMALLHLMVRTCSFWEAMGISSSPNYQEEPFVNRTRLVSRVSTLPLCRPMAIFVSIWEVILHTHTHSGGARWPPIEAQASTWPFCKTMAILQSTRKTLAKPKRETLFGVQIPPPGPEGGQHQTGWDTCRGVNCCLSLPFPVHMIQVPTKVLEVLWL